jgi:MFS family permease
VEITQRMGDVAILIAAHACSMLGFSTFAALLPQVRDTWSLTNTQAGIIGGMFFAGYIASVWYWTGLTDRTDARRVYAAGAVLTAAGSIGFGLLARGFGSAVVFQALLGTGIAGTYMPGLRMLSDRTSGLRQSRSMAIYTASFGVGAAASLALAGAVAAIAGWRAAFITGGVGPVLAGVLVLALLTPMSSATPRATAAAIPLATWRDILRRRSVVGYTLGYTVHCLELFGSRGWAVAFLTFSSSLQLGGSGFPWRPQSIAAVVNLLAVGSSIAGNEIAQRLGRRRWILFAMAASGTSGIVLGVSAPWHWPAVVALLVLYALMVNAESATLTVGLVSAAPPQLRGSALGLYSLAGFGGGMLGPVIFGAALDAAGGRQRGSPG